MPEGFRSFAAILAEREAPHPLDAAAAAVDTELAVSSAVSVAPAYVDERVTDLLDAFLSDLARLRARAAERLEEAADSIVGDLARRVLARELTSAPADIEALVSAALADFDAESRVVVRLSPFDAERVGPRDDVTVDPRLRPGDFALDVDEGRFDASLQTRLEAMLASHRIVV